MGELMSFPKDEIVAIISSGVYPESPVIAEEDWKKIVAYYMENAPEKLQENPDREAKQLTNFTIYDHTIATKGVVATQFDKRDNSIFIGTTDNQTVKLVHSIKNTATHSLTSESPVVGSPVAGSPVVKRLFHEKYGEVQLEIGKLDPSDIPLGKLKSSNKTLITKLHRPVDMVLADVNEDGTKDFIIANFGNLRGNLSWYDGRTFKENTLSNEPGTRVIYHLDFDKDGKKDILALQTQGRESVIFFKNIGRGKYQIHTLLTFPPVYGSSYFDVVDFDNDGDYDIVYTNGDNADYSIVKKPYHGVRIFLNNGRNKFDEKYFYPINGASKVVVTDFDRDGDYDMAVISYFPDKAKNEGFLYFEQNKPFEFEVKSRKNVSNQKWLTLDYGDFDNNGFQDIVLGTMNRESGTTQTDESNVVLLLNKSK